MVGWRFWASRLSSSRELPDQQPPAVDDAAAEGVAMAEQAAMMSIKNRILVDAHTADDEFDIDGYLPDAREILDALAAESDQVAERTRADRKAAARLRGRSMHQHDYRYDDLINLDVRIESFEQVASQLRQHANDDDALRALIIRGRDRAWAELAREMERSLDGTALREFGDEHYADNREERLRAFVTVDLYQLQQDAQQSKRPSKAPNSGS